MTALESQILASLLEFPDKMADFSHYVKPYHFSEDSGAVYSQMLLLHDDKKPISIALLLEHIPQKYREVLLEIQTASPIVDFMEYIPEMERRFKLRTQEKIATELLLKAKEGEIADINVLTSKIPAPPKDYKSFADWANAFENMPAVPKFKTGVDFLDLSLAGGFETSQMVLLSGEPEAGKTSLGLQILEFMAKTHPVCFFCFEFTARQYITRKMQNDSSFIDKAGKNLYIINDGYDISQVSDNIKHLHKQGVKVFLIDSQMRIDVPKSRSMEEEESAKFSTLAKLAHNLEILIILVIQTAKSDPNNPMGSKKGGHESSITIRIEHTKPDKELTDKEFHPNKRTIIIKKNKQTGKHFKEEVFFDPISLKFKRNAMDSMDEAVAIVQI
ncbi:DnaB-like helicase C-terminal domain-containing protein [Helicobacter sp. 11S02596-1]|uniref:DnaB-like helicase C-terminal domain-containing protein n=1 Tax=Helicobacter sp. 11S02596-1 TaxID=1476194 RepID=UPI000BA68961|nr:DnaB-like helicase C-terminal domain-containing protein [Helicobacter sp. 11S02596-1]PAF41379.1 hypothetical protein BJI48_08795 [Helicobacter sp. 11S02596-1]